MKLNRQFNQQYNLTGDTERWAITEIHYKRYFDGIKFGWNLLLFCCVSCSFSISMVMKILENGLQYWRLLLSISHICWKYNILSCSVYKELTSLHVIFESFAPNAIVFYAIDGLFSSPLSHIYYIWKSLAIWFQYFLECIKNHLLLPVGPWSRWHAFE